MNGDIGGAAGSRCFRSRKLTTLARAKPVHALVRSWLSMGSLSWGAISGGGGAWSTGLYGRSRKSRRSGTMLRLGLNATSRGDLVALGIVPPVRTRNGLHRKRPLPLERPAGRADGKELRRLVGWHALDDRAVERAVAPREVPFLPHAQEIRGEQAVEVAVLGELVVLASGDEDDRGPHGGSRVALHGVLQLVVHRPVSPVRAQRDLPGHVAVPHPIGARRGSPRSIEHRLCDGAAVAAVGQYEHA